MSTAKKHDKHSVSVEEYVSYQQNGYLIVRQLFSNKDMGKFQKWMKDIYEGRINLDHLSPVFEWTSDQEKMERLASARVHMPHRHNETAEWGMLHPKILDILEALIGPDVVALQSMMFFNPPGKGGQGWHQDSFYIQTQPDSLIGVWMAMDHADKENGCLWVAPGSHREPIYPPVQKNSYVHADERHIKDLFPAKAASHMDDSVNQLSEVAAKYGDAIPVELEAGDVLFFHSHLLHRSYRNETKDRMRQAYVCHYCNARSWVPWNHGADYEGEAANSQHILARGRSHLPYTKPKFGTPVELSSAKQNENRGSMSVAMPGGDMGKLEM
jgi:phytanoyl-CoA hydroxylase